jgi:outer membrane lipoprotein-sorting protein
MRFAALLCCLLAFASPAGAQSSPPAADDATAVMHKMLERNAGLRTFRSRVDVRARMLNFPFLSEHLKGTTYFSAPDTYEVVFDRVPSYAKSFSRVFDDIGDPAAWSKDNVITLDGSRTLDGTPVIVLRLVKKIHSDRLDHALAFVDARSYALLRMEWDYTSGGQITMSQTYRDENGFEVLAAQHAVVRIPYVHAVADARYGPYDTNVALELPAAP